MWKKLYIAIVLARFITPFFIFSFPLWAMIVSFSLDTVDAIVAFQARMSWHGYSVNDKLLDYWWYIFILIFCINTSIFPVILVLFLLRSVGQFLMLYTRKEKYLFWFPNILEIYFIFYILSQTVFLSWGQIFIGNNQITPLLAASGIVIPREYLAHMSDYFYGRNKWSKSIKDEGQEFRKIKEGMLKICRNFLK